MNNKTYDILKYLVMIALPSIAVFITSVGSDIGIENPDIVVTILNAITALLGALIGLSSVQYNRDKNEADK